MSKSSAYFHVVCEYWSARWAVLVKQKSFYVYKKGTKGALMFSDMSKSG